MPLPFFIGSLVTAAGVYVIKKWIDVKKNLDEVKRYNEKTEEIYYEAEKTLEKERIRTSQALQKLANLKLEIYKNSLKDFIIVFGEIKKVEFIDNISIEKLNHLDLNIDVNVKDIKSIEESIKKLEKISENLNNSLDVGKRTLYAVQLGASGISGTMGTLTAASYINPTLAWIAGSGMVVTNISSISILGGVTFTPILAIGGIIAAKVSEKKKYEAYVEYEKAKVAFEQIKVASEVLKGIYKRGEEFIEVLKFLDEYLRDFIYEMREIVNRSNNWKTYTNQEKEIVMIATSIAKTIKNICETPIIDENGEITEKSKKVLIKAKELSKKLEEV